MYTFCNLPFDDDLVGKDETQVHNRSKRLDRLLYNKTLHIRFGPYYQLVSPEKGTAAAWSNMRGLVLKQEEKMKGLRFVVSVKDTSADNLYHSPTTR